LSKPNDLIVKEENKICTLILNSPEKRNVVTPSVLLKIKGELTRLNEENKVRCVIISGSGEKVFSSGYDIKEIGEKDMMRDYYDGHPLSEAVRAIENFPYPVIAQINGHAFGAGLEIAATCDIRISAEDALFALPPAKLGVAYAYSGVRRFINLIGPAYTKELFLIGKPIDSRKAKEIGLINYMIKRENLETFTHEIAKEITLNAPLSLKTFKKMINLWQINQTLDIEDENFIKDMLMKVENSEDYKEGQKAFSEKRKPVFNGY